MGETPSRICGAGFPRVWRSLLVAPLVFRVPRVLCGAGLLCVPVGGGPPASRPRRELRSARRLEARPGPAAAHGHRSQAPPRSPPWPSGPSGALHTGGAWPLCVPVGGGLPACCCLWPRGRSGHRVACLVGRAALCARGRRPAREPSAPRAFGSARRLEARPGPATAHGHRSLALQSLAVPSTLVGLVLL